jgi:hypothetical protein
MTDMIEKITSQDDVRAGSTESGLLDRRGMLTVAAAAAAGLIGSMAVPGIAAAATGSAVTAGTLSDASNADPGLWGRNNNTSPAGGVGVLGVAASGDGVEGHSVIDNKSGVWGHNDAPSGMGVTGDGGFAGVWGRSATGDGVRGQSSTATKSGVYGLTGSDTGYGVFGAALGAGAGVAALAGPTGTALHVEGKASFTRSGVAAVAKNKTYVTITVPSGVATTAKFLVTLQGNAGATVGVAYAKRTAATTFRVYFTKKTTKASHVGWMVLD